MGETMKLRVLLSATALTSASFIIPTAAWAADAAAPIIAAATLQAAPARAGAEEADKKDENIVVTGSRIRRPNIEASVPTTSISGDELFNQGQTNIGDTLNDLPQLRSTFAQQNPGAGVGIAGLNLLDLRGLGTIRTLVLVNGRRHVASDILNNASSVDVSTIPNDLVDRVDIVTGGNSAVYGSDAIAGVVNFVLKRDFNGVQVRGNAAVSMPGGYGANQYASILAGKNFGDGRGNITAHIEYANQARIYASDIPFLRQVDGFAVIDTDSGGLLQASDGFPDNVFVRDIRSAATHRYGFVAIPQPQGTGRCGFGTLANNGPSNTAGTAFDCAYFFSPEGNLTQQTGTRFGSGPLGTITGGNGQTGRDGTLLSILPSSQRINANILAHYEFSPALEVFLEAKYVRTDAIGNQLGPTFVNNSTGSLNDIRIAPRLDNPFLNPADRALIAAGFLANNCTFPTNTTSTVASVTCTDNTPGGGTAAQEATKAANLAARNTAIANGTYRFLFARTLTDSPDRDEIFRRNTYRVVGGLRGTFNDDWRYEVSANYGRFEETADMRGFVDKQRFFLSFDAGRNPVTGQIQCRAQFDPAAATGLAGNATAAAKLAADIAACVPYNPFGAPNNSAAANYFKANIINKAYLEQIDLQAFVSGDTSQFFNLPGGPVRFVLGGEYRREKAFNNSDSAADTLLTNSVFLGDFNPAALQVKEGYGEIEIPVLKDRPFFHELTLSGAGRISSYNNSAGTTYTYNAGLEYSPIRDIRFRANYGRAVRAPNVTETGAPPVPNFANGFVDPCNANSIGNNTVRNTNCTGQLSATQIANIPSSLAGYTLNVISGSNPNLQAEESDSFTYGLVIQPRFLPGFSLSVDYYNIKVKNVIVSLSAQTIVNSCYDSPNLSSPLCASFARNLTSANGPNGELPGQIIANSTVQGPQNFASRVRRGLDVEGAYRTNITSDIKLSSRVIYTHSFQNSNFENPTYSNFENYIGSELGDPIDEARIDLDVTFGKVTFGYGGRILGSMYTTTFENLNANNAGRNIPGVTGLPLNSDIIDITEYPMVFYHDLRANFQIGGGKTGSEEFNFYVGVDNVTNQRPPLATTATGAGSAIYSIRGRNFYAGFKARF